MPQRKLLIDTIPFIIQPKSITQGYNPTTGKYRLKGIIQVANKLNKNGRIYPRHILQRQINKLKQTMHNRALLGQLDHPEQFQVSVKNACILIIQTWWVGDQLWGQLQVLSNGPGTAVRKLIFQDKVLLGISSRGSGTTIATAQGQYIQQDYSLITFDIVSQPSTFGAYPRPVTQNHIHQNKTQQRIQISSINKLLNNILINV